MWVKTTCSIFLNAWKEMNRNKDNAKYPFIVLLTAHLGPKYRSHHSHQATGWTKQESWVDSWPQQELFLSLKHPDWLWNPPILLFNAFPILFPRSKVAGAWSWLLTPPSAQVKYVWNYTITTTTTTTPLTFFEDLL